MPRVRKWQEIRSAFDGGTLLLGNGASIALSESFAYGDLYEYARANGHLSSEAAAAFERFGTRDFEQVLEVLAIARKANELFGVHTEGISRAYEEVRRSLIRAVKGLHPQWRDLSRKLRPAAQFCRQFSTVLTTNYDLTLYWLMLHARTKAGQHAFKDCFGHGRRFRADWTKLRAPHAGKDAVTLVFFVHGALMLARDYFGAEQKIVASKSHETLPDAIDAAWEEERLSPVFISEGESHDKRQAILRSPYLRVVFEEVLTSLDGPLVIYGSSISERDHHVFEQIPATRLAVSVRGGSECAAKELAIRRISRFRDLELEFFEASSPGAWIHEESGGSTP